MTDTPKTAPVVGQLVHFYGAKTLILSTSDNGGAVVTEYGAECRITDQIHAANVDKDGNCWLDLAADPDAQVEKFGKVIVKLGPWPEGELRMERGSPRWQEARGAAMREANALQDPADQAAARRAVRKLYGEPETTSRTFIKYPENDR